MFDVGAILADRRNEVDGSFPAKGKNAEAD